MGLLVSFLAGLSTIIGYIIVLFKFKNTDKTICVSLSFSAGVMLYVCVFDLLPNSFMIFFSWLKPIFSFLLVILFFLIGVFTSICINFFSPQNDSLIDNNLYKSGIQALLAITLHNIPEGIVTLLTANNNYLLGIKIALAIALHNIPEGITVSVPIYYSTNSKHKAFVYTAISGLSETVGAVVALLFLKKIDINFYLSFFYAFVSGIMMCLVFKNLFIKAFKYYKVDSILYFLFGLFIMGIVHLYI